MTRLYKITICNIFVGLAFLIPTHSFAASTRALNQVICNKLDATTQQIQNKELTRETKLSNQRKTYEQNVIAKRAERDTKQNNLITEELVKRTAKYNVLLTKAKTDEQRQAVNDFKIVVEQAIQTRRDAIKLAQKNYQDGIDALYQSRKQTIDSLLISFKTSTDKALREARTNCARDISGKTIETQLKQNVEQAHAVIKTKRDSMKQINTDLAKLAQARTEAVQKAEAIFQNTIQEVQNKLKQAFK